MLGRINAKLSSEDIYVLTQQRKVSFSCLSFWKPPTNNKKNGNSNANFVSVEIRRHLKLKQEEGSSKVGKVKQRCREAWCPEPQIWKKSQQNPWLHNKVHSLRWESIISFLQQWNKVLVVGTSLDSFWYWERAEEVDLSKKYHRLIIFFRKLSAIEGRGRGRRTALCHPFDADLKWAAEKQNLQELTHRACAMRRVCADY